MAGLHYGRLGGNLGRLLLRVPLHLVEQVIVGGAGDPRHPLQHPGLQDGVEVHAVLAGVAPVAVPALPQADFLSVDESDVSVGLLPGEHSRGGRPGHLLPLRLHHLILHEAGAVTGATHEVEEVCLSEVLEV